MCGNKIGRMVSCYVEKIKILCYNLDCKIKIRREKMQNTGPSGMNKDKIGLELSYFENICYLELIKQFVKVFSDRERLSIYGDEEGLNSYFVFGLQLDASVFLY